MNLGIFAMPVCLTVRLCKKMNLALEEYLDYLKEEESISASIEGGKNIRCHIIPFFSKQDN